MTSDFPKVFCWLLRFQTALGQARPSRAARKMEKNQNQVKAQKIIGQSKAKGAKTAQSLARALIWLAAKPAPKPLSMFTTVTPLPQLLSMPSSAATPPKLAP